MAESSTSGFINLEKELTCAICTEILYQPLTLLNCLHTFCGSCLKLWFPVQAARSSSSRSNPYTCPTCREQVRATSSDAKINTLLEMYLIANPDKAKSPAEIQEIAKKYTKGENVIPKRSDRRRGDDGDTDRRMVEEVREMSLREGDSRDSRPGYERGIRHRQRSRDRRRDEGRSRESAESNAHARHIEHQSSLRSLISTEELDSDAMVAEILRQISEEGLLDDVDTTNLDTAQISEMIAPRIAATYRQRHERGRASPSSRPTSSRHNVPSPSTASRPRTTSRPSSSHRPASSDRASESAAERSPVTRHARSASAADEPRTSHPPVSRPHLLDADAARTTTRRRRSNESRRQTSPNTSTTPVHPQATRSATDLSTYQNSTTSSDARPEFDISTRRNTEPRSRRQSDSADRPRLQTVSSSPRRSNHVDSRQSQQDTNSSRSSGSRPSRIEISRAQISSAPTTPRAVSSPQTYSASQASPHLQIPSTPQVERLKLYLEPSLLCDRCGKAHIEYDLYEHCSICNEGNYNLCHRCYREGKGCLHWFGFGNQAWYKFQRSASQQEPPHALVGQRFSRPKAGSLQPGPDGASMSTEEPANRLQTGAFCSRCQAYADDCFWKCDTCNDGEWGYCNQCVNTGHCCTHPLLPLTNISTLKSSTAFTTTHPEASLAPVTPLSLIQAYPSTNINSTAQYRPLTFSTNCHICHYPIQPSQSRFHCYTCQNGDYDICNPCYSRLVDSGRISRENSDKGWRRCPKDHRMVKVWFKDSPSGQQRVIENDLVGGWFLEDRKQQQGEWSWVEGGQRRTQTLSQRLFNDNQPSDPTESVMLQKFLPDGGVGLHVRATYPWLPAEESTDELAFPRGAEIREVWEMNDWLLGSYAGDKGLFPRNHVTMLRQVTM